MAEELRLSWQKKGMERLKWFDFLGALLLLFSVTRAAITPQVVNGDSNSAWQQADNIQDSEGGIDLTAPSTNLYLERDSKRLSAQNDWETYSDLPSLAQRLSLYFMIGSEGNGDDLNRPFDSTFVQTHSFTSAPFFIQ